MAFLETPLIYSDMCHSENSFRPSSRESGNEVAKVSDIWYHKQRNAGLRRDRDVTMGKKMD